MDVSRSNHPPPHTLRFLWNDHLFLVGQQGDIWICGSQFQGTEVSISAAAWHIDECSEHACVRFRASTCTDSSLELRCLSAGEAPSSSSLEGRCLATSQEKKASNPGDVSGGIDISLAPSLLFLTCCLPPMQLSKRPTETGHLRHRPDQADLHAASRVVQADPGAAALLRGQEEPNIQSNKDQPDLQQGQLCVTHTHDPRTLNAPMGFKSRARLRRWFWKSAVDVVVICIGFAKFLFWVQSRIWIHVRWYNNYTFNKKRTF